MNIGSAQVFINCDPQFTWIDLILSKPQLNHNLAQPNITLSWVRHENDPTNTTTQPPQKLNLIPR